MSEDYISKRPPEEVTKSIRDGIERLYGSVEALKRELDELDDEEYGDENGLPDRP